MLRPWIATFIVASLLSACAAGRLSAVEVSPAVPSASAASSSGSSGFCSPGPPSPSLPAGPLFVSYVHPEGAWFGVCQGPVNGALRLRFGHHGESPRDARSRIVWADGETLDVDAFVAVGPRGRWVVAQVEGQVELIDTEGGARRALRALGPRDVLERFTISRDHPPVSFDRGGRSLAYVRETPAGAVAVVHDLATGDERTVPAPTGQRLLGARIDPEGAWLWIWSVPGGRTVRAYRRSGGAAWRCNGPSRSHEGLPAPARGGLERRAIAISATVDGEGRPGWIETGILTLGDELLSREPDGSLALVSAAAERTTVVPSECDAFGLRRLSRESFAVLCRSSSEVRVYDGAPPRLSVTYGFDRPIEVDGEVEWDHSRWITRSGRTLDLEGSARGRIPPGAEILAEHAGHMLYRTGDCAMGIALGENLWPLEGVTCNSVRSQAGAYVLVGDHVVDLLAMRVGVVSGYPWAVHESGVALVTTERRALSWQPIHFLERPCRCGASARSGERAADGHAP